MSDKKEVSFSDVPTPTQAVKYVKQTLSDGTLSCRVRWSFDEAQADSFHHGWTEDYFKRCLEVLTNAEEN